MKNKTQKIYEALINYIDIIIFGLYILLCDFYLKLCCGIEIGKLSIIYNIAYISFISIFILLFNKKIRYVIEIILMSFLTIFSFTQSIYYSFFATYYRFKKLKVIKELNDVLDETYSRINFKSILIIIFLVLFIIILIAIYKKIEKHNKTYIMLIYMIMFVISTGAIFIRDIKDKTLYGDRYLRNTFYSNVKYVDRFGVCDFLSNDFVSLFNNKGNLTEKRKNEIKEFISENDYSILNEYSNIYKNKNLILIECESLNNFPFIETLTPTLCKLKNEGLYFSNFYAPLYGSATSDAEFISLTSMMPSINEGQTCYTYANNNFKYSLPNLFKQNGYSVNSYHANYAQFYNRDVFHKALGFDNFYDLEKLGIKNFSNYIEDLNWVPDTYLFDSMINHTDTNSHFFNFVTTVSGHMPYVDYREEIKDDLAILNSSDEYNYMNNETKAYVASQMSLDRGLEILLDKLEEKNILYNTIIILFGDHYPYGVEDLDSQYMIYGTDISKYKTPLIIYDPSNPAKEEKDNLVCTFDIYPTICNLFDLDSTGSYKVGKDVFEDNHLVLFENRSVLSDDFYYDSLTDSIEPYDDNYNEIINKTRKIYEYGECILIYDFYSN